MSWSTIVAEVEMFVPQCCESACGGWSGNPTGRVEAEKAADAHRALHDKFWAALNEYWEDNSFPEPQWSDTWWRV